MAIYLRPRRGKKSTAESQNIILKRGEIFFESPETGVGTGVGKIKIGDGTTVYKDLPYFLEPSSIDVSNSAIAFTEASSGVPATLLSALASGAKLNYIIGIIKKLLSLHDTSITNLQTSFQNGCSTIANAINANGVTTATNASPNTMATNINTVATNKYNAGVTATKVGTAVAANVLTGKTFTNSSGVGLSGSMVDRGAWTNTPTASGNVTIPAGYHNGSGYVNTATVYNNGYTAGAASGKKYVKVTNVKKTSTSGAGYGVGSYHLPQEGGSVSDPSVTNYLHIISWTDVTGGTWIPSVVRLVITNGASKYYVKLEPQDLLAFYYYYVPTSGSATPINNSRVYYVVPKYNNPAFSEAFTFFKSDGSGLFVTCAADATVDIEAWG